MNRTPGAEDYIKWMKDENDKYFIHILGVSVLTLLFKFLFSKKKQFRQLSIQVLLFIFQDLLPIAPVLALDQSLVHILILMLQLVRCLPFSKVLQVLLHSLVETCLPCCMIIWLKN